MKSSDALKCVVSDDGSEEQEGKDVFEYSVSGNSEQKTGNFTQTKLEGY